MLLTAELGFTIFMLAAEKHKGTYLAPVGIGLALFIAELAGVYYTGGMWQACLQPPHGRQTDSRPKAHSTPPDLSPPP